LKALRRKPKSRNPKGLESSPTHIVFWLPSPKKGGQETPRNPKGESQKDMTKEEADDLAREAETLRGMSREEIGLYIQNLRDTERERRKLIIALAILENKYRT
jgi:hypothetical protein